MVAQVHPAPPPVVDVDVERGAIVVTDVVSDDEDAVDDEPISQAFFGLFARAL